MLPLDDRVAERVNPDLAGRPVLIKGKTQILFGGMGRLSENCVVRHQEQVALRHRRDRGAAIAGAEGVIIAQGANIGGWSLRPPELAEGLRLDLAFCDRTVPINS